MKLFAFRFNAPRVLSLFALAALVGFALPAAATGTLFFSEDGNADGLYTLSIVDGSPVNLGSTTVSGGTVGLAPHPDPTLLFGSMPFALLEIATDGSGAVATGGTGIEGLAFDAISGTLFGAINGDFFTVNTATGAALDTLTGPGADVEGIAFGNGGVYGLARLGPQELFYYDPGTDTWVMFGSTGITWNLAGLAFDPNTNFLYAKGSQDSNLYRINPVSTETTLIGDTAIANGGGLAFLADPPVALDKDEQRCVLQIGKDASKVSKTQGKDNEQCLKNAAAGKTDKLGTPADAQSCLTNDVKGKVAKAEQKTVSGDQKRCTDVSPPFAYEGASAANDATTTEMVDLVADLFGPDLDAAVQTEKTDAKCQQAALKQGNKLVDTIWKVATKAAKTALRGKKVPAPETPGALAAEVASAVAADSKVSKTAEKVVSAVGKSCTSATPIATLFPGVCSGEASAQALGECVATSAACRACRQLTLSTRLFVDCDTLDDGASNGSCPF